MINHTHLIVIPTTEVSLAQTFKPLHMRYSQRLNKQFTRTGVNWQGRFFSSAMDEAHTWAAFQYVNFNPVKANLVELPENYQWSSARSHLYGRADPILTADERWISMAQQSMLKARSVKFLEEQENKFNIIHRNTLMNLPVGSDHFIEILESKVKRNLTFRQQGGQRKKG